MMSNDSPRLDNGGRDVVVVAGVAPERIIILAPIAWLSLQATDFYGNDQAVPGTAAQAINIMQLNIMQNSWFQWISILLF